MNLSDSIVAVFSPQAAAKRVAARHVLAAYDGGTSTKRRRKSKDNSTSEKHVVKSAEGVRATMREMERNHDLVRGALLTLTRNVVGANGISIEPTPRFGNPDSSTYDDIDDDFARELLNAWREFCASPEVTKTMDWVQVQEMAFRTFARDGEVFAQMVEGFGAPFKYSTAVPFALELLEADVCPLAYNDEKRRIDAGIQRNEWGAPLNYCFHKNHPGNGGWFLEGDVKIVSADNVLHFANRERLSGLRGISLFASAIDRLFDVRDYENSEQIAARIAARMTAYIKRDPSLAENWTPPVDDSGKPIERDFLLEAGSLFTDLFPGEEIGLVNPNRPNTGLEQFRSSMLRAASRPIQLSYSSMSGDFDGTYSAQRQELVEAFEGYRSLTALFVSRFVKPVWERWVPMAILSGRVKVPAHIRPETVAQASFRGPKMPWINPVHEATGVLLTTRAGLTSLQEAIAERGGRLQDTFEQISRERKLAAELGLVFDSDAQYTTGFTSADLIGAGNDPDTKKPDSETAARIRVAQARYRAILGGKP